MSILNKVVKQLEELQLEAEGWKGAPKGWTGKSIAKHAKTMTGKSATAKGFFEKCVKKMKGKVDNPEAFCAAEKDEIEGSTHWRGKDKPAKKVQRQTAQKQNVKQEGAINEFRAENVVDFCKSLGCPRKTLKCLLKLRLDAHCKYDIECQKSVDREMEFIYQQFDNQGGKMVDPLISGEEMPAIPDWLPDERPNG